MILVLICLCRAALRSRYRVWLKSQRSRVRNLALPHTFVSPSADSRRAVVSFWRKYVHEILVNRLGGLSLAFPSADSRRAVVSYWRKYVHEVLVNRFWRFKPAKEKCGQVNWPSRHYHSCLTWTLNNITTTTTTCRTSVSWGYIKALIITHNNLLFFTTSLCSFLSFWFIPFL